MSDNPLLKRAGDKVASLHETDHRLRAKAVNAVRVRRTLPRWKAKHRRHAASASA